MGSALLRQPLCPQNTTRSRDFLKQHPRVQFHFTPTYSSWLNQIEIWFAKIEREVIARGIFTSVADLARKLRRYINAYSANAAGRIPSFRVGTCVRFDPRAGAQWLRSM
jgi:hypothetical protein